MTPFDVVIIGAGSAGCAFARHLCDQTSCSMCLVEAGPDYGAALAGQWPAELLDPRCLPSTHDRVYQVAGSAVREPRAKVIEGCSAHNQCGAFWGHSADYDAWAEAGNPGWTYTQGPFIVEDASREDGAPHLGTRHNGAERQPCCRSRVGATSPVQRCVRRRALQVLRRSGLDWHPHPGSQRARSAAQSRCASAPGPGAGAGEREHGA
jgi:choline dehydrogenase-like flavoprotein